MSKLLHSEGMVVVDKSLTSLFDSVEDEPVRHAAQAVWRAAEVYRSKHKKEPTHALLHKHLSDAQVEQVYQVLDEKAGLKLKDHVNPSKDGKGARLGITQVQVGVLYGEESPLDTKNDSDWVMFPDSDNLHAARWIKGEGLLVKFKSDPAITYRYASVPKKTFAGMVNAKSGGLSAGELFDKNVKAAGFSFVKQADNSDDPAGEQATLEQAMEDPPPVVSPDTTHFNAEAEAYSVLVPVRDFIEQAEGDIIDGWHKAIKAALTILEEDDSVEGPIILGLPNPGTPPEIRSWAVEAGGTFDYNHPNPEGGPYVWARGQGLVQEGGEAG